MKHILLGSLLITALLFTPAVFSADDANRVASETASDQERDRNEVRNESEYRWHDKLKRGAVNVISSPLEIFRSVHTTTQERNLAMGWTVGLVEGLGQTVIRLGAGAVEILTFPFNFPDTEKRPLIQPEYVWDKSGPEYI